MHDSNFPSTRAMSVLMHGLAFLARTSSMLILYALCHIAVTVLTMFPVILPMFVLNVWEMRVLSGGLPLVLLLFTCIGMVGLAILISVPAATALARFALRLWPIDLDCPRSRRIWHVTRGILVVAVLNTRVPPLSSLPDLLTFPRDVVSFSRWLISLSTSVGLIAMWVGAVFMVSVAHLSYSRLMRGPYVLFLRRFSSFADRILMGDFLRSIPEGLRPVFMASPPTSPANWDFWLWAFSGLRFRHPLRSLPLQFKARDPSWIGNVANFVRGARCIVVEETTPSLSIEIEHKLVANIVEPSKVIRLSDSLPRQNVLSVDRSGRDSQIASSPSAEGDLENTSGSDENDDDSMDQILYPSFILYVSRTLRDLAHVSATSPRLESSALALGETLAGGSVLLPQENGGLRLLYAGRNKQSARLWRSVRYSKDYFNGIPGTILRIGAIVVAGLLMPGFPGARLPFSLPFGGAGIPSWTLLLLYSAPFVFRSSISRSSRTELRTAIRSTISRAGPDGTAPSS